MATVSACAELKAAEIAAAHSRQHKAESGHLCSVGEMVATPLLEVRRPVPKGRCSSSKGATAPA
jgi:hypothetical protein